MRQKGQSLVELLIVIPLFFILLSGINLYFNQNLKQMKEKTAFHSLQMSDVLFDDTEKKTAHWINAHLNSHQSSIQILNQNLNSNLFDLKFVKENEFQFFTKTKSLGFEKFEYDFDGIHANFKNVSKKYENISIFSLQKNLQWSNRSQAVLKHSMFFLTTLQGVEFANFYASPFTSESINFNGNCFMFPFDPSCKRPGLSEHWRNSAYEGANHQVLECFLEMSLKCAKYTLPAAIAACMAEGTTEISSALSTGIKASVCPILNQITEIIYQAALI